MSSRGHYLPGAATRSRGLSAAGGGQRRGDRVRRRFQDRSPRGDDGDDHFAEHLIFSLARPGAGTHPSGDGSGPRSAHGADLLFLTLGDSSHAEINSACPGDFPVTGRSAAVAGTIALAAALAANAGITARLPLPGPGNRAGDLPPHRQLPAGHLWLRYQAEPDRRSGARAAAHPGPGLPKLRPAAK
jgi:hypothetical protein